MKGVCEDRIPMAVLEPIIRDWARRTGYALNSAERQGYTQFEGGVQTLARLSGVSERRIGGILNGGITEHAKDVNRAAYRCMHVSFDTADRLLCAMHMNSLWHTDLAEWYGPIRVAGYEKHFEQAEVAA